MDKKRPVVRSVLIPLYVSICFETGEMEGSTDPKSLVPDPVLVRSESWRTGNSKEQGSSVKKDQWTE